MNNSQNVKKLKEFLESLEQQSQQAVSKLKNYIEEDPEYGYAKAAGYAESQFDWVKIQVKSILEVYLSN
jgi:hypothetical protein